MLWFSADVELPLLQASLKLHRTTAEAHGLEPSPAPDAETDDAASHHHSNHPHHSAVTLAACSPPSARCAVATAEKELAPGELYALTLPAGSQFHTAAGATHDDTTVVLLSGLVPFAIPFKDFKIGVRNRETHPKYRRLKVWLRHGLADGTTAADLAPHLSVTAKDVGPLPVSLSRPSAGVLQIEGAFEPDRQYVVAVAAADGVRDGFGLPLQTSSTTFRTAALPQFFSQGGTQYGGAVTARFAGTAAPAWPVLTRGDALCLGYPQEAGCAGKGAKHTDFVAVGAADVAAALASLHNYRETQLTKPVVASLVAPLTPSLARTDLQLYGGAHAAKQPRLHTFFRTQTSKTTALVSSGELGATAVAIPGGEISFGC